MSPRSCQVEAFEVIVREVEVCCKVVEEQGAEEQGAEEQGVEEQGAVPSQVAVSPLQCTAVYWCPAVAPIQCWQAHTLPVYI